MYITLNDLQQINIGLIQLIANNIQMARSREEEYSEILGSMISDKINMKLIIDSVIDAEADQDNVPLSKKDKSSSGTLLENISKNRNKIDASAIPGIREEDEEDFKDALQVEGGKRFRQYEVWEPPKFKLLGYSQTGLPIFKMSDVYMTSDPKMRNIIDKQFNEIIYGGKKAAMFETGELSKKFDKGYDLQKLVQNWKNKEYEDFETNKKNIMDKEQLEEIVVNRGDEKHNYWLYKNKEKRNYTYEDIGQGKVSNGRGQQREPYNHHLANPNFYTKLQKAVKQKKLQYIEIEEFESDEEEKTKNKDKKGKQRNKTKQMQDGDKDRNNFEEKQESDEEENEVQEEQNEGEMEQNGEDIESEENQAVDENSIKYWGEMKDDKSGKKGRNKKRKRPSKNVLLEQEIIQQVTTDPKKGTDRIMTPHSMVKINDNGQNEALIDAIIKEYNIINQEVVQNCYQGKESLKKYNRIQFHLENPNFFMTKLHFSLQKKSDQFHNYVQGGNRSTIGIEGNRNPSIFQSQIRDQSVISGSLTGNQQTVRASNFDTKGFGYSDDDHETIEQKILKEMNHYSKKTIKHSEVATKLMYIKFSTQMEDFYEYHRFQFKYDYYLKYPVKVQLIRHLKPLKCKGTNLDMNLEKQDPDTKFERPDNLSLASEDLKQFILVEYIEENPLLMSDVGMCERMVIQTNYQEMLRKIQRDYIENIELDNLQEMRDNPQTKSYNNISTQEKMKMWRQSIKESFGENGKIFFWEPKRKGMLIGNPEGTGVALMESNLGVVPVVKKNPNKCDFLLVRDGGKWVLRRIDCAYVSGQVEPKEEVFSHGDRPYQNFLEKYQMDFIKKFAVIRNTNRVSIQELKGNFPNTPNTSAESRIRKILKQKMRAVTKDNRVYQIVVEENNQIKYMLKPEQFCLYQRMQKSLCELGDCGIVTMKNMEKMKSILKKYFRKNPNDFNLFATARMVRDQLQLTSWYLTESFHKFIEKKARIQMYGHADPTNGHGGYSYIKKPQKERTDKEEAQQKEIKKKLSGTAFDLRKLKAEESVGILEKQGYNPSELKNRNRWQLVNLVKKEENTEYSRKERQTKQEKEENERKERSKCFNKLLKILRNQEEGGIETYDYDYNGTLTIDYYCNREERNWINCKQNLERMKRGENQELEDDDDDDDDS